MSSDSPEIQLEAINRILNKGVIVPKYDFKFGKYKGHSLKEVFKKDKKYLLWLAENVDLDNTLNEFIHKNCI